MYKTINAHSYAAKMERVGGGGGINRKIKEELNFLKEQQENELEEFLRCNESLEEEEEENKGMFEHKMIKGLEDRIIISVDIKPVGYMQYTLDAQVDTGAMNSCAKYGVVPHYYWQNINMSFGAVNKTEMKIEYISPDFPLYIQNQKIPVTLYSFDTGTDILLGQDFVNKCLSMTVSHSLLSLTYNGHTIKVPSKTSYESRIVEKALPKLEQSAKSLIKIQKIINNVQNHKSEVLKDIREKIERNCTSDNPNAFWTREQYFVNLPYKEDYLPKP